MWELVTAALTSYAANSFVSSAVGGAAAAQGSPAALVCLVVAVVLLAVALLACCVCNLVCCAGCFGISFGFAIGRGRGSALPAAVGEGVALAGEVAAAATSHAAAAGRRRLAGYQRGLEVHASDVRD